MLRLTTGFLTCLCLVLLVSHARAGGDEKTDKLINQFLKGSTKVERLKALTYGLEVIGPKIKGVLQALKIGLAKDPEPEVRREVALVLGRMGEGAIDTIGDLTFAMGNDPDDRTRECAARALGSMVPHSKRVLKELAVALKDKYFPVRAAAAATIKNLGPNAKSAVPQLIEYLKDKKDLSKDSSGRMYAALALGRVGPSGAKGVEVLAEVLADENEDAAVREAAAEALGRLELGATRAAKELADVVKNPKSGRDLRLLAVKALAKVEAETSVAWPAFKVAMEDSDKALRLQAVRVVGPYAKEEQDVVKSLAKLARNDDSVDVRLAAVQELGGLGAVAKAAEADLRLVIENEEIEVVRNAAAVALKKIQAGK
jgi:HEAT repeat protein